MHDAQCIQVEVEAGVLELCAIVTSDMLDLDAIVVHGTVGEAFEDILHFQSCRELCAPTYTLSNNQQ